jgi:hypothetical protein
LANFFKDELKKYSKVWSMNLQSKTKKKPLQAKPDNLFLFLRKSLQNIEELPGYF